MQRCQLLSFASRLLFHVLDLGVHPPPVQWEDSQCNEEESSGTNKYSRIIQEEPLFFLQLTKELPQNEKNLPEAVSLEAII